MKKTFFALVISLAFLSHPMRAQTKEEQKFKERYLLQAQRNADAEAKAQLVLIIRKYKLDGETYKTLYQAYYNRRIELDKAMMASDKTVKSQNNLTAVIKKYDSISNSYLLALKSKNLIGDKVIDTEDNSKFANAVRNRDKLKLNKEQIDNLIYQSKQMAEMKKETPSLDLKSYERKLLPTILTDEQYTNLLIILNRKTASDWAKNSWKNIQERGIDQGLDSTKVNRELFNYNLAKLVKKDRFGNDKPQKSESLNRMNTEKPEALRRLNADEARNIPNKPEAAKTNFVW